MHHFVTMCEFKLELRFLCWHSWLFSHNFSRLGIFGLNWLDFLTWSDQWWWHCSPYKGMFSTTFPPAKGIRSTARLRFSFFNLSNFLLTCCFKSGAGAFKLLLGLHFPRGGVPNDGLSETARVKNPMISLCTMVTTQCELRSLVLTQAEWPQGLEY